MRVSQSVVIELSEEEIECLRKTDKILKEIQKQLQEGTYTSDIAGEVFHTSEISRVRGVLDTFARDYLFEKR
jgi:hypothetical protein